MTVSQAKSGYKSQASDTSIETDLYEFALLRQRTNSDRIQMAANLMKGARRLSLSCLKQQFPSLSPDQFAHKIARAWLQEDCPINFTPGRNEMSWIQDSNSLAVVLHGVFEQLEIPYYVTGGMAAIAYGEPRTTRDVDIVFFMPRSKLARLAQALESTGFYVPGLQDVEDGRMKTLSVTHIETVSRADLIVASGDAFDVMKFNRRRLFQVPGGELYFASPEDVILNKLRWGKQSQSEKQWRDVLGVLKVQGETLDLGYLQEWSRTLGLEGDLLQAYEEAGF